MGPSGSLDRVLAGEIILWCYGCNRTIELAQTYSCNLIRVRSKAATSLSFHIYVQTLRPQISVARTRARLPFGAVHA